MKRGMLKLCILTVLTFFAKSTYAAEDGNMWFMEHEDLKTEKMVYESPENLKEISKEFSEFELQKKNEEDVLLADY